MDCSRCGAFNSGGARYCSKCGVHLQGMAAGAGMLEVHDRVAGVGPEAAPSPAAGPEPTPSRKRLPSTIVAWGLVALLLVAAAFLGLKTSGLSKEVASERRTVAERDDTIDELAGQVSAATKRADDEAEKNDTLTSDSQKLKSRVDTCTKALELTVRTWNNMIRSHEAVLNGSYEDFVRFLDRMEVGRRQANRSLRKCRTAPTVVTAL